MSDWMDGMSDFQRAEVARLESRIVSCEKRFESLEADWNDCRKALAAAIKQRDEARENLRDACDEIAIRVNTHAMSMNKTAEIIAEERGWDCYEGGGA
jgi:predicted  nucleic acid-binding Zn-ribbon protein